MLVKQGSKLSMLVVIQVRKGVRRVPVSLPGARAVVGAAPDAGGAAARLAAAP